MIARMICFLFQFFPCHRTFLLDGHDFAIVLSMRASVSSISSVDVGCCLQYHDTNHDCESFYRKLVSVERVLGK